MAKQELIPVEQARALLLDTVNTLETEKVPLIEALGRISAKNQTSDIDIYVETETPNPFLIVRMKAYLEKLLGCSVDVIRAHKNMNAFLKQQIEKDGIHVF